jgi:probable pyridine nucleotide-disulfide oxidoreductase
MKAIQKHYDNLIIGFGKGAKTLAAYLARHGQQVALVEKSAKMYGGTCINIACIPTKSLILNAEKGLPYEAAYAAKNDLTSFLRAINFKNIDSLPLATVLTGQASFVSPGEVMVKLDGGNTTVTLRADRIFISTGTEPFVPPIPGIQSSKRVFTSTSFMEQSGLAGKLIIIGGGFVGLEFASMYAQFGAQVTLLDAALDFLPREDKDIADEIFKILTARNIRIVTGAAVQRIEDTGNDTVNVRYRDKEGSVVDMPTAAVLIAAGRKPVIEGLNLAAAGVKTKSDGYIMVDEFLKTNVPNIWAIGDINGGPQFTYTSLDDFRIIRDQLFGGNHTSVKNRKHIAFCVFITPPFAHIGLREREAIEKGRHVRVAKLAAAAIPRARILGRTEGLLKAIVDADTSKILGCTLLCAESSEMINTIQTAINAGLEYQVVRDTIYTHPSMTEAYNDLFSTIDP